MLNWNQVWCDRSLRLAIEAAEREIVGRIGPITDLDESRATASREIVKHRHALHHAADDFAQRRCTPYGVPLDELHDRVLAEAIVRVSMGLRAAGKPPKLVDLLTKGPPRYWVDIRIGCCAVRDNNRPQSDRKGLDAEMEDVVQYWDGEPKKDTCPTCSHETSHWELPAEREAEAKALCDRLNAEEAARS